MIVGQITCPVCRRRIEELEPDTCLKKRHASEMYFYHNRCAHEPQRIIAAEGETT